MSLNDLCAMLVVRGYRHRERVAFAAFVGHRYEIDQQHGTLIAAIADAARATRRRGRR